jgi:predicted aspartyl protease
MTKFNFEKYGRVFLPIFIKPQDDTTMLPFEFMVDTGADNTTISKVALSSLGYDMDWIQRNAVTLKDEDKPKTATGEKVNAGYVQLPLINILGYEGKNWAFQLVIEENHDFMNLLGRDLLTGFNYTFDNDEDKFTIARAKAFKPRNEFLPGQGIHSVEAYTSLACGDK